MINLMEYYANLAKRIHDELETVKQTTVNEKIIRMYESAEQFCLARSEQALNEAIQGELNG